MKVNNPFKRHHLKFLTGAQLDGLEERSKVDVTPTLLLWILDLDPFLYPSYYLPGIYIPYFEKWIYTGLKFLI